MKKALNNKRSLKSLLISETLKVLVIWVLLLMGFGVFQVSLYRDTQLTELQSRLVEISKEQSLKLASFLSLNEEATATRMILQDIKAKNNLAQTSISQSFFSLWPEKDCKLSDPQTEVCRSFWDGKVEVRHIINAQNEKWYLYVSKTLNRPWGSQGWWAASLLGFVATMIVLAILFIRLIFVLRSEVLVPAQEVVELLSASEKEKTWWLERRSTNELAHVAEKLFDQQRELENKTVMAEVGKLSAKVAHDIRSPLSLLNVLAQKEQLGKEEMHLAKTAITRIDAIAGDLLNAKNNPQRDDRGDLLWLQRQMRFLINEKSYQHPRVKIQLEIKKLKNEKLGFKESKKLMRAIENLVKNAIEACEARDQESVLKLSLQSSSQYAFIEVLDTGCGMTSTQLQQIAVGQVFSSKQGGHGLGLSSAQDFIQQNNGSLKAWSLDGGGSLFQITYPLS